MAPGGYPNAAETKPERSLAGRVERVVVNATAKHQAIKRNLHFSQPSLEHSAAVSCYSNPCASSLGQRRAQARHRGYLAAPDFSDFSKISLIAASYLRCTSEIGQHHLIAPPDMVLLAVEMCANLTFMAQHAKMST